MFICVIWLTLVFHMAAPLNLDKRHIFSKSDSIETGLFPSDLRRHLKHETTDKVHNIRRKKRQANNGENDRVVSDENFEFLGNNDRSENIKNEEMRQIAEFSLLGKYPLGQIRSQLDYDSFLRNYDLNIGHYDSLIRNYDLNLGIRINRRQDAGETNSTKCFGNLGCLEITEKWYGLSRPVNLLPLDKHIINTQFFLRKRGNFQDVKLNVLEPHTMKQMDKNKPTKIIIHGFIDTGFENWVKEMSDALLAAKDVNVVVVDWGGGSLPLYSQAAANTRLVGMEIAHIVNSLIASYGFDASDIHIIGHSLGAHIAGYAGEKIHGLGRISGLDPAEPLFQDMPNFVRLDPSDADFVDVIHTDATTILMGGYGMYQSCGHVDFYPNGGKVQPGCSLLELPGVTSLSMDDLSSSANSVGRHLVACAHNRAISLYIDSIINIRSCPLIGHKCESYEKFESGECYQCGYGGMNCAVMGYGADTFKKIAKRTSNNKMFLDTGSMAPFCKFHYMLKIHLAKPREAEKWVKGFLKVNLYGDQGELTDFDLTPEESEKLVHGDSRGFPITLSKNLGKVSIVHVYWEYDHNVDPFDLAKLCLLFCSDSLYVRNVAVSRVTRRTGQRGNLGVEEVSLCGEEASGLGYSDVTSSQWKLFYKECRPTTVTLEVF